MEIITFFECENEEYWIEKISNCDWDDAHFLTDILEQNKFVELLGGGDLFILTDEGILIFFATLTKKRLCKG